MDGRAKAPFVRHSVQRQRQSFRDQRVRLSHASCKNRDILAVPDQHRPCAARGGGRRLQPSRVHVGKGRHPSRRGTDAPAGLRRDDRPPAVPHRLGLAGQGCQGDAPTSEFTRFARHDDPVAGRRHPRSGQGRGEIRPPAQPGQQPLEPIATRRSVPSPGADQGGGDGADVRVARQADQILFDGGESARRGPGLGRAFGRAAVQGSSRPGPGETRILVGGVVDPARSLIAQPGAQLGASSVEQRPLEHESASLGPGGRRRPVPETSQGRAFGAHPLGLGDVVGGMGEQDDPRPRLARGVRDQAVPGRAGRRGQAGRGLVSGPGQPPPVRAGRSGRGPGEPAPVLALRVQPMIDRQGQKAAAVTPRPVGGDPQQGDRIAAAGQGQGDGAIDVGLKPRGQAVARPADPAGPGRAVRIAQPPLRAGGRAAGAAGAAAQAKRVRISPARVRRAGDAASA